MLLGTRALSLSHRIVASVALGLGLILALFGLLVLWTISESAEAAYRERVVLAQALAQRVDDILRQSLATLRQGADPIVLQAGQPLLPGQRLILSDLRLQMGMDKLGLSGRAALVRYAVEHGLLEPAPEG